MKALLIILLSALALLSGPVARAGLPPDPIDGKIPKPVPTDTVKEAKHKCYQMASEAAEKGITLLVLGIEGQGGFSADNAWLVYRYLWRLHHGLKTSPPELNTLAPVLHRLLLPLIETSQGRLEVLDFPETAVQAGEPGAPGDCVVAWRKSVPHAQVVLLGHSYGGDAVHELALSLGASGIPVERAYSMDPEVRIPSKHFHKPTNVGVWTNFLQRNEPPFGAVMMGAERNYDLSPTGANHRTIVRTPFVLATILQGLGWSLPLYY